MEEIVTLIANEDPEEIDEEIARVRDKNGVSEETARTIIEWKPLYEVTFEFVLRDGEPYCLEANLQNGQKLVPLKEHSDPRQISDID